ncbi:integrase, catalytic region, zinc finger, CCHC-type containing protein [Tanacetum coccineum]
MDFIIPLGQKNTLAEYMKLSDADNRPPMLDKDLVAKNLWERVQLLIQGTSLTKQEREYKLYDAFDKFTHIKGESLHKYYLRFTQLINDMNIYNMKMEQFQVNNKFSNSLPPEWSFAVPIFSPGDDPIACLNRAMAFLIAAASSRFPSTNNQLRNSSNPRNQATIQDGRARVVKCYNCQGEGHMARQCTQPKRHIQATGHSVAKKFRGDKGKVILLLGIRVMLLVLGKGGKDGGTNCQVDRKGLLNAYKTIKVKHMARQYALSPKRQGMHHGIRRKQC